MSDFTHFNEEGRARMVDVTAKDETVREAIARGYIYMNPETLRAIQEGKLSKGDVLGVAQVAAVMGVKNTSNLIPMCHPLIICGVNVTFNLDFQNNRVEIQASVKITGKTGVEMEALTGVSVAALTIYDMCKAIDKDMVIDGICLMKKTGGKSGTYIRG
jgi:cyclic pyranopterin monophosphate synthase